MSAVSSLPALPLGAPLPVPVDPNTCGTCGGRVITTDTEAFCSMCGAVRDAAPIVSVPLLQSTGPAVNRVLQPVGVATEVGGRGGRAAAKLRFTQRRFGKPRADPRGDHRWATVTHVSQQLGLAPALSKEVGTLCASFKSRGHSIETIGIAASILVGRRHGIVLSIRKSARQFGTSIRSLNKVINSLKREAPDPAFAEMSASKVLVSAFERLPANVRDDGAARKWAIATVRAIEDEVARRGKTDSQRALATVPLFYLGKSVPSLRLTQTDICSAFDVTEVSVRTAGKRIVREYGHVIPPLPSAILSAVGLPRLTRLRAPTTVPPPVPIVPAAPPPKPVASKNATAACPICGGEILGGGTRLLIIVQWRDGPRVRVTDRPVGWSVHRSCVGWMSEENPTCVECGRPASTDPRDPDPSARLFATVGTRRTPTNLRLHRREIRIAGFTFLDADGRPTVKARRLP